MSADGCSGHTNRSHVLEERRWRDMAKIGENRCAQSYEVELDWQRGDLGPFSPSRPSRSPEVSGY